MDHSEKVLAEMEKTRKIKETVDHVNNILPADNVSIDHRGVQYQKLGNGQLIRLGLRKAKKNQR